MQKMTFAGVVCLSLAIMSWPAFGQSDGDTASLSWNSPLVIVQCLWLALVAIGAPYYASRVGRKNGERVNISELRGLNFAQGVDSRPFGATGSRIVCNSHGAGSSRTRQFLRYSSRCIWNVDWFNNRFLLWQSWCDATAK